MTRCGACGHVLFPDETECSFCACNTWRAARWGILLGLIGWAAIFLALSRLCGCTPAYQCPTTPDPNALVSESELRAEWFARFGPLPSPACDATMQWLVKSDEQTQADCRTEPGGHTSACLRYAAGTCPIVTISERSASDLSVRAHEAAHWYLQCTWIGTQDSTRTAERWADPYHTIARVWGAGGFVEHFRGQQ